ncbi:MAG: helix-turn-helix transcriptional regulator [Actinobacteria bacterium]|nr:helix-turn-helix transcriptional regulator [Actinomycetota bacterium]
MFGDPLRRDRGRSGWSIARASWLVGVSPREYRDLEAGLRPPSFEAWSRVCELFGWA